MWVSRCDAALENGMKRRVIEYCVLGALTLLIVLPLHSFPASSVNHVANTVRWSSDGGIVVTSDSRGTISVIDVTQGTAIAAATIEGDSTIRVAANAEGTIVAAVSTRDRTLYLLESFPDGILREIDSDIIEGAGGPIVVEWSTATNDIIALALGIDGANPVNRWRVDNNTLIRSEPITFTGAYDLDASPDGRIAIADLRYVEVHDLAREMTAPLRFNAFGADVAWGPDDTQIAEVFYSVLNASEQDGTIRIIDLDSGTVRPVLQYREEGIGSLAWHPDGRHLFADLASGRVLVIDTQTGEIINTLSLPRRGGRWLMDVSPYGGRIVLGSSAPTGIEPAGGMPLSPGVEDIPGTPLLFVVPLPTLEALSGVLERCEIDSPTRAQIDTAATPDAIPAFIAQIEALPEGAIPPACKADLLAVARAVIEEGER
ncbi:MAG: WD40 repeat domain-containing protein [Chloroflexi bacterium]|nr:WD40 repeat domain-containing protein [Chloroflexota bacterium]